MFEKLKLTEGVLKEQTEKYRRFRTRYPKHDLSQEHRGLQDEVSQDTPTLVSPHACMTRYTQMKIFVKLMPSNLKRWHGMKFLSQAVTRR
jgi:hypothetical protein